MVTLLSNDSATLARAIQRSFPLAEDPWQVLAEETGLHRHDVLRAMSGWAQGGELREISAVFEGEVLGYESALVAAAVPAERLEQVAAVVGQHPTVTHSYERSHATNLWFTLAVPPRMGLARTLSLLARESGVEADRFIALPRAKTFKIGVSFDLESRKNDTAVALGDTSAPFSPSEREVAMVRALQTPLPIVERPFERLAEGCGLRSDELLRFASSLQGGALRRYVATFRHRKLGVRGNGMVVWQADDDQVERAGPLLAAAAEVSHCYSRPPFPGFPYSLYSMVHGPDEPTVREIAQRLSQQTGLERYEVLFSTREFKKTRLRYFLPELDAWWTSRVGGEA